MMGFELFHSFSVFLQLCVEVTFVVPVALSYPQASLIFIQIT